MHLGEDGNGGNVQLQVSVPSYLVFLKKRYKKRQIYTLKEDLQKRTFAQNINIFVLI